MLRAVSLVTHGQILLGAGDTPLQTDIPLFENILAAIFQLVGLEHEECLFDRSPGLFHTLFANNRTQPHDRRGEAKAHPALYK